MAHVPDVPDMKLVIYFLALNLFSLGFAQNPCDREISGKVLDLDTNEPLPFATVSIKNTQTGVVSDESGHFIIKNVCDEEVDLEVRFLGYKTATHHHDFHHPSPIIYMASDETMLESVVVEKELNAHELKTLNPKSIQIDELQSIGTNAGNLFSESTGVSTLKTGQNIVKPIVHGLHSNRVLIINNGVRHSYQAWGTEHGVEIDASQIDRIQLIKGASTVRYGSDALGGVILFNAHEPTYNSKLYGELNGGFQSNGRALSGELQLGNGYERAAWHASISGTKQGDLRAADYLLTNTGKEEFGFTASGKFHFPALDVQLFVSHFDQKLGILRGSVSDNLDGLAEAMSAEVPSNTKPFSYDINNPRQETTHDLIKAETSLFIGEQQFDFQYAFQRNVRKEFDVRRGTNNERPSIDLELFTHSLDLDWDHPSKGNWSGTWGLQAVLQDNNNLPGTNTIPFVPNYNTTTLGAFGIESYESGNTTYEAGIRFDFMNLNVRGRDSDNDIYRENLNYNNFTFTLGVIKELNTNLTIRSNIGSAWRAPNVNELYSYGKHQNVLEFGLWRHEIFPDGSISTGEVLTDEDKEVKSERGLKWVTSFNWNNDDLTIELVPHFNWIKNCFFLRPYGITDNVRGTFPFFIHDQTDAIYTGIDLDVSKKWPEKIKSELKVSYVYARDIKNDQFFVGIPPLNIGLKLSKEIGKFTVELNPEFEAMQSNAPRVISPDEFNATDQVAFDRSETFDFLKAPDAFFLLNSSVRYSSGNLSVKLQGQNVLNSSYRRYTDNLRYYADDQGVNIGLFAAFKF